MEDTLILIPARSGSTRVKNKNLKPLGGKPLVAYPIQTGLGSKIGRVVVSTNDSEISKTAQSFGASVPFLRPDSLSQAASSSLDVILHALEWFQSNEKWVPEFIAFCPPTNPFLKPETLTEMKTMLKSSKAANSVVTITQARCHPFRIVGLDHEHRLSAGVLSIDGKTIRDLERTQDWPKVFEGSPACRMTRSRYFLSMQESGKKDSGGKTYDLDSALGYEVDGVQAFDIDDEMDWMMAEALVQSIRRDQQ